MAPSNSLLASSAPGDVAASDRVAPGDVEEPSDDVAASDLVPGASAVSNGASAVQ